MSDIEKNAVTWQRFEHHGSPLFRTLHTESIWELVHDGDGWRISQDGTLVKSSGPLDEAMAWVGGEISRTEEERELDTIDRIMPDEGDQGDFHRGLVRAMQVFCEFLPPARVDDIILRLNRVRGEFEGFDLPPESVDEVAGLAVGMAYYCLWESVHPKRWRPGHVDQHQGG